MAKIVYPELLKQQILGTGPDLSDNLEVVLCMSNNDCAATPAANTTADLTLDAITDGTADAYLKVVEDTANRRSYLQPCESDGVTNVTQLVFAALAAGARDVSGILWRCKMSHPTHPLLPIAYTDFTAAAAANGEDFKVNVGKITYTSAS